MTTLTTSARNAAADAVTALAGSNGLLKIYTAAFGLLLSTHTVPSFGAASTGVATAATIADATIAATGTAAVYKMTNSSGTEVWRGTVGTSGADCIVNNTAFASGGNAAVSSFTYTQPAS